MNLNFDFRKKRNWAKSFFDFDIRTYRPSDGMDRAWEIFHYTSKNVPAYDHFLKKRGVNPKKINTFSDIPIIDKQNYIQAYPAKSRAVTNPQIIAMSSGTSGNPTFWPRGGYQEFEQAILHEHIFNKYFNIAKHSSLCVIGFPMGVYVSGVATLIPLWLVSQKYPKLTLAPVGNDKERFLETIKGNWNLCEQIIFIGHPFFVKDVLETGIKKGIDWSKHQIRLLFCSEGFSEDWRRYVAKLAGIKEPRKHILNTYGSSELLLIGHETPNSNGYHYNPFFRFAETLDDELLFTAMSGVPLVRFNIHDLGSLHENNVINLKGRSNYSLIFYAANIYPEHIRSALNREMLYKKFTGKFTMQKKYKPNKDETLLINLELRPGMKPTKKLSEAIKKYITKTLLEINLEYNFLWKNLDKDIEPQVKLHRYQEPTFFPVGIKPKYIQ